MKDIEIVLAAVREAQRILYKQLQPEGITNNQAVDALHGVLDDERLIAAMKRLGWDPTKP